MKDREIHFRGRGWQTVSETPTADLIRLEAELELVPVQLCPTEIMRDRIRIELLIRERGW